MAPTPAQFAELESVCRRTLLLIGLAREFQATGASAPLAETLKLMGCLRVLRVRAQLQQPWAGQALEPRPARGNA